MTATRNASIGSISHGTMRTADLISAFAWELDHLTDQTADDVKLLAECNAWDAANLEDDDNAAAQEETGSQLVEALFDALSEHTPAYCYFGANEGDGSDYGFWPEMDAIDDLDRFNDLADVPDDIDDDFVVVNDHGNLTLYNASKVECWSIV